MLLQNRIGGNVGLVWRLCLAAPSPARAAQSGAGGSGAPPQGESAGLGKQRLSTGRPPSLASPPQSGEIASGGGRIANLTPVTGPESERGIKFTGEPDR